MPSLLSYYSAICKRVDGSSNDPVIVFDTIAKELEGGAYLGHRIASHCVPKVSPSCSFPQRLNRKFAHLQAYHCGTPSVELVTISRWFDHARWRLLYSTSQKHTTAWGTDWDDPVRRPRVVAKASLDGMPEVRTSP
jgi:hypothetical protein